MSQGKLRKLRNKKERRKSREQKGLWADEFTLELYLCYIFRNIKKSKQIMNLGGKETEVMSLGDIKKLK